jgi:hypothetical protein
MIGILWRIKGLKQDRTVVSTHRWSKRRVLPFCMRGNFVEVEIGAAYQKDGEWIGANSTLCCSRDDIQQALDDFSEPELLSFLEAA